MIPNATPIVTPDVAPTSIPFFQPNTSTIKILNIFLIENPKIVKSENALTAIANKRLVPITYSIEKAFFSPIFSITEIEFVNIL